MENEYPALDAQFTLLMAQDMVKRVAAFQREYDAIINAGEYEIPEMADSEDVAQIVSHT